MKKLLLIFLGLLLATNVYSADINDWSRGDMTDVVEGDETISTLDDQITNYMQAPLEKALANHITGCTLTITDDEVITVSSGSVVTTSASSVMRMRQNTSTATVDNTAADVGGLDTGAVAADTWYYVYAVADADATTFTLILSASATNPTNAAALYYRLIGCALTDATSDWLKAYYFGDGNTVTVMWDIPTSITTTLSNGAWSAALDCSAVMPSISKLGIFGAMIHRSAGDTNINLRPNGSTWSTGRAYGIAGGVGNDVYDGGQLFCFTDSSQQIQYRTNSSDSCEIGGQGFVYVR